jgi:urea transport system permease protein
VRAFPDLWYIVLGGLFILVVLFLPGGLVSIPKRLSPVWEKFRSTKKDGGVEPTASSHVGTVPSVVEARNNS